MQKYVVIVAGGKGERMKADKPKQFLSIGNRPILMHTIEAFRKYSSDISIIITLPQAHFSRWKDLCEKYSFSIPHTLIEGGETRYHSVKNGLSLVPDGALVAIHDGVRPFVNIDTIKRCFRLAQEKGNAIPTVELIDSIRLVDEKGSSSVDRTSYRLIQTPQAFQSSLLKKAYEQEYKTVFTDDASIVENFGEKIFLCEGNIENIKITNPIDLEIAEVYLNSTLKS